MKTMLDYIKAWWTTLTIKFNVGDVKVVKKTTKEKKVKAKKTVKKTK